MITRNPTSMTIRWSMTKHAMESDIHKFIKERIDVLNNRQRNGEKTSTEEVAYLCLINAMVARDKFGMNQQTREMFEVSDSLFEIAAAERREVEEQLAKKNKTRWWK